jgi:glycosyltransferase involved in cell wall biosynthesis
MKIVLDLQPLQTGSRYRGIGRYTLNITKSLAKCANENTTIIAILNQHLGHIREVRSELSGYIDAKNIKVFDIVSPVLYEDENNFLNIASSELLLDAFVRSLSPDVYHCFSLFEGYDVYNAVTGLTAPSNFIKSVTHHDLIPLHNGDLGSLSFRRWYANKIKAIRLADKIFAVSEYAKNDLVITGDVLKDKVNVAYGSHALKNYTTQTELSSLAKALAQRYGISKRFILCSPGGFDDSKNINNLIVAYSLLPKGIQDLYSLVITSKIDAKKINLYRNIVYENNAIGKVVFTNYITDIELMALMAACDLFVVVSIHEGFGLPAVEAMACGAPVITSNTTSLPEITGLEQELFNPESPIDISEKINIALTVEQVKTKLKENSRVRTDLFSWDKSARKMIEVWNNCYE